MKGVYIGLIIAGIIALIIVGVFVGAYNNLVNVDNNVNTAWSEVENQYQRQYDLIPNLIDVTKQYMAYESDLLTNLTQARTQWSNAATMEDRVQAGTQVNAVAGQFMAVVENYPNLKSVDVVYDLMTQLEGTQNRITVARGRFIETTRDYNLAVRTFPGNIFASMFGFREKAFYQAQNEAISNPNVNIYD